MAALEAGTDVLLEKPLAPTLPACDRLIETARRTGRVLSVGHELRLSEQWNAIKRLIEPGDRSMRSASRAAKIPPWQRR